MWLWIKSAYDWAKENLLIIGAAIGSLATLIISLLLTRHDKSTEIVLEHNQESNDNRRKHDQVTRELTEKYLEDLSIVREQAKAAGEELSEEQEGVLVERLESFSSADTEQERLEIAEEIQEVFPFLNMVDPSSFGKVE